MEDNIPLSPNSVFQIASMSKQFTALSIAILIESGQIGYNDPIQKYLPEVPTFNEKIEIQHLIHHTSGLKTIELNQMLAGRSGSYYYDYEEGILYINNNQ
jgi:CubicO group peptidase (beta-lactamase class C family)